MKRWGRSVCSVIRGGGGRPDSDAKTRSKRVACAWLYLATTGTRVLLPHDIVRDALVDSKFPPNLHIRPCRNEQCSANLQGGSMDR